MKWASAGEPAQGDRAASLYENIRSFHYSETATIIMIVVLTVMLIDMISSRIRGVLV